ncbi:MAG: glycosyltransferase [Coriobacteriia bacterium]|nr:glycosyltransferase [Coriobacteriia bacterium]
MRITMVNKYYSPPHLGGVETVVATLSSALAARGVKVSALVANEANTTVTDMVDGVRVTRLARIAAPAKTPIALGMRAAIRASAGGTDPADVIQLNHPYPWGEAAWLASGAKTPMVIGYHADITRQKRLLALYRPVLDRVFGRASAIVASSPNIVAGSEVLSRYADKCRVIPYGIDPSRYDATPQIDAHVARLRAAHERPVVLFVGRLVYYKGADVLVRAMRGVDADLVIVGSGPLEGELRDLAVAGGISARVTFLPSQPFPDLVAHYRAADVLCLPSTARAESFGIVQLEAQACGVPCVSTDIPTSVPYVNLDGVTGITVPAGDSDALADALQCLVTDTELRTRLGRQARERVLAEFTIEQMVSSYLALYRELSGAA